MSTVSVIGSVNIDDSIRMARLPGPGETVGARGVTTELGGKGANQADRKSTRLNSSHQPQSRMPSSA